MKTLIKKIIHFRINLKIAILYGILVYVVAFVISGLLINIYMIYLQKYSESKDILSSLIVFKETYIPILFVFFSVLCVVAISFYQVKKNPFLSVLQGGIIGFVYAIISVAASYLLPHDPIPINVFTPMYILIYSSSGWMGSKFGKTYFSLSFDSIDKKLSIDGISQREKEVIKLLMCGYTNNEIGQKLFITESTVKTHVKTIFRKSGCRNRVELVSKFTQTK